MKGLTKELKQLSLNKWEEIKDHIKNKDDINYWEYWTECGFCKAVKDCYECDLFILYAYDECDLVIRYAYPVCHSILPSSSMQCLSDAINHDFKEALKECNRVIKAIKKAEVLK